MDEVRDKAKVNADSLRFRQLLKRRGKSLGLFREGDDNGQFKAILLYHLGKRRDTAMPLDASFEATKETVPASATAGVDVNIAEPFRFVVHVLVDLEARPVVVGKVAFEFVKSESRARGV